MPGTMIAWNAESPSDAVTAVVSDCIVPITRAAKAVRIATIIDLANDRVLFRIDAPSLGPPWHPAT